MKTLNKHIFVFVLELMHLISFVCSRQSKIVFVQEKPTKQWNVEKYKMSKYC